jgi:phosphohistidine swiveling domain-containing protein
MSNTNLTKDNINWKVMYEGPAIGHLLAYQVFIECFEGNKNLLGEQSNFYYDHYLFYSDSKESGGIHGGYYRQEDLDRATKQGERNFFDETWLNDWYSLIDEDSEKVCSIMEKHQLENRLSELGNEEALEIFPTVRELELRLLSWVRCSQPQFTDALKNKLHEIISQSVTDKSEIEDILVNLTLPEQKSLFTLEELGWLDILFAAKEKINREDTHKITRDFIESSYPDIADAVYAHFSRNKLIPASDRTPAWDLEHFYQLLRTNLLLGSDYKAKKVEMTEQYDNVLNIKRELVLKYSLPEEALVLGSRISKVGYYRFKASFYWRWMGYYIVLMCEKFSHEFGLTFKEMSSMTKEEFVEALSGSRNVSKEELAKRADAELYLHEKGKDYLWYGEEAREKRQEILGIQDYTKITELKGEVGSVGHAVGKAFVFQWSDDVSKKMREMPEGSILVAPQTHPTYMPAIRMAAALVCDEGGITGHAAIVSRELKKPCVIGIHIATKVIQTGDELEVDARTGIVKIIKKV